MTRDEAKQLLPIIQAYSEGKDVQRAIEGGWMDDADPTFFRPHFRIKPEPIECWAVVNNKGSVEMLSTDRVRAEDFAANTSYYRVLRMREVL